jgi:hypothetical protein
MFQVTPFLFRANSAPRLLDALINGVVPIPTPSAYLLTRTHHRTPGSVMPQHMASEASHYVKITT